MKANCEYCGSEIDSTLEECPHCGAKNPNFARTVEGTPKTIEELKAYCDAKGLKLDKMHIHLGEDFKEPKAFGIFKNESNGHFVVYKNKANGQRAVRYDGTDEAYAVNELYMKIKDLLADAREATAGQKKSSGARGNVKPVESTFAKVLCWIALFIIAGGMIYLAIAGAINKRYNGYYEHRGHTYYRHDSYWYEYDPEEDIWEETRDMSSRIDKEEFLGRSYDNDYDASEFPVEDYSSDWGSDDDWSSDDDDSWNDSYDDYDFGGGDWDSDWRIRFDFGDVI